MSRIRRLCALSIVILFISAGRQLVAAQTDLSNDAVEAIRAELLYGHIAAMNAHGDAVQELASSTMRNARKALLTLQGPQTPDSDRQKPSGDALNSQHLEEVGRLSQLSGPEFDREYVESLIPLHQNLIRALQENQDLPSEARATIARDILPAMERDLIRAKQIQKGALESNPPAGARK